MVRLPSPDVLRNLLFALLCGWAIVFGLSRSWERMKNAGYTGHAFHGMVSLYSYDCPFVLFDRDGCWEYVDSLEEATAAWFLKPDSLFFQYPFSDHPVANDSNVKHWTPTPVQAHEDEILSFALWHEANAYFAYLNAALHQKGSYYAYSIAWLNDEIVKDILFLFLSPRDRKFIVIASNT